MKIIQGLLVLVLLTLLSCNGDPNSEATLPAITSYKFQYMDFPSATASITPAGEILDKLDVVYSNGKIVKLIGGVSELDAASGFPNLFRKDLFKELTYNGNTLTIIDKLDSDTFTTAENKKTIELNAENRMITKVNYDNFYSIPNDTIKYFYQGNLLIRTEYHRYRMYKKSLIYYNAQKNVDSIVTITPTNYNGHLPIFDPTNKMRTVEQFENYDTSQNPMKQFGIFEETFHRSLSKNNYRKYTSTQYDSNGTNNGYDTKEWEFIYQNGQVNFSL